MSGELRTRFCEFLQRAQGTKKWVAEGLVLALDNTAHAAEVVLLLRDAIGADEANLEQRWARLMLVSDILHNSSLVTGTNQVWSFRMYFEYKLPDIFEVLGEA